MQVLKSIATTLCLVATLAAGAAPAAAPGPGDVDPLFYYPLPSQLEPDSTNLVSAGDGWLVVRSVLPPPGVNESKIELTRIDLDGRIVPTYGQAGRVTVTVPAPVNVSGVARWLPDGSLLLGGYQRTTSADGSVAALVRIAPDGRLVTAFGNGGVVTIDAQGSDDRIAAALDLSGLNSPASWAQLYVAVWSRMSSPGTGCATDRASIWPIDPAGTRTEESYALVRDSTVGSCRSYVGLGWHTDENTYTGDEMNVMLGTQLGIYDATDGAMQFSGERYGPIDSNWGPLAYLALRSGSIGLGVGSRPIKWIPDPSAGIDGSTSWQALTALGANTFAAFATDGGRAGIVRVTSGGDIDRTWGSNGLVTVQGSGRDGVRASSGLANDVRYLAEDETGGLVVAMADGVIRRYVSTSFVPGGLLFLKSPAYSIVRARSTVPVEVNRIGHAEGTATVRYDVGGDCTPNCSNYPVARAGEDFVASSGVLEWAPGERGTKTINVEILAPTTSQPAEIIPLKLSSVTGGASLASPDGKLVLAPETVSGVGGGGGSGGGGGGFGGGSSGGGGGGGTSDASLLALLACLGTLIARRRLRQTPEGG